MQPIAQFVIISSFSVTAELLAGAQALSLADRCHFELSLADLLDKSTQCKRNWLLNVLAERQQAHCDGIQTPSVANSKLTQWMTTGRASECTLSTASVPTPHPSGQILVPSQSGPKMPFLQLKMTIVITLNGQALCLCFQQPRCAQNPTTLTQNPQQFFRSYSHKWMRRSTTAKCSTMESPCCGSTCCGVYCTLLCNLIVSQLKLSLPLKLTSFCCSNQ